jgi:hypothetical protein
MSLIADCDTLESCAAEFANNHKSFDSFSWWGRDEDIVADPAQWGIYHPSHRDSSVLDKCNAAVIEESLQEFIDSDPPTVIATSFNHWAVGYVDALIVRVYNANGGITPAYRKLHELLERLQDYPVLDEERLSADEYEDFQESWSSWGEREFRKGIESLLQSRADDEASSLECESDIDRSLRIMDEQRYDCPHTGIPAMVCACGDCHNPDPYRTIVDRFDNLVSPNTQALWDSLCGSLNWEYQHDDSGCLINIDGALRLLSSWETTDILELLESQEASTAE